MWHRPSNRSVFETELSRRRDNLTFGGIDRTILRSLKRCSEIPIPSKANSPVLRAVDILKIRKQSKGVEELVKIASLGIEIQNDAALIRLESERAAGSMLAKMELKPGKKSIGNSMLPIADLGVTKMQSSRWQTIASLPQQKFDESGPKPEL